MRFLGLGLTDKVPDAKTIWAFRERLTKAGEIEALFTRFDRAKAQGDLNGRSDDQRQHCRHHRRQCRRRGDVETIDFRVLGGADNIFVGDLSWTDVAEIEIDLRSSNSGGDGAADTVTVSATQGADVFGVTGDAGGASVFGLQVGVDIFFAEAANGRLVLNGLGGDDVIDATSLGADGIQLTMNGGLGNDVLLGARGTI